MPLLRTIATTIHTLIGVIWISIGILLVGIPHFEDIHEEIAQVKWEAIDSGLQLLILVLLRFMSGLCAAVGLAMLCLVYSPLRAQGLWASFVILLLNVFSFAPFIYCHTKLKFFMPGLEISKPNYLIVSVSLGIVIVAFLLDVLDRRSENGSNEQKRRS